MPKLKALHQIRRRTDKGVLETIKPGTEFDTDADEAKFYVGSGAAIMSKGKVAVSESTTEEQKPLDKMKKAELIDRANQVNGALAEAGVNYQIEAPGDMTNAQLVTAIQDADERLTQAGSSGMLD